MVLCWEEEKNQREANLKETSRSAVTWDDPPARPYRVRKPDCTIRQ